MGLDLKIKHNEYIRINSDVFLKLDKNVEDNSVKLIVTSPPYNLGKEYESKEGLSKYLEPYKDLISTMYKKLSPDGSICWQVGNFTDKGEIFPLDCYFFPMFKEAGFKLRNRIIWHFEHGLHAQKRLSGRYETILWFTKTDNYTFNLDSIRVPSKYPGKRKYKGLNKGELSGNPLGKNPSDFWRVVNEDWEKQVWEIVNVKSNHPEKTIHPCQFPIELVERCIVALTNEDDLVLDPFMGVGSSAIASLLHNRKFLGFEKELSYLEIADERVNQLATGNIKIRPLTKKVYQPTGREKVAQIPLEWALLNN